MSTEQAQAGTIQAPLTANEKFKRSFSNWFWGSMIAATALHFALFQFFPELQAEDVSFTADIPGVFGVELEEAGRQILVLEVG